MQASAKAVAVVSALALFFTPILTAAKDICVNPMLGDITYGSQAAIPPGTDTPTPAAMILEESYQASAKLSDEDRAYFLVRLTDFSTDISPNRTGEWCRKLFEFAKKKFSPSIGWNKVATEKNALVPLAKVDPATAFELLSQVDKSVPAPSGEFIEDVRADAATKIFVSYLRFAGTSGIAPIQAKAAEIANGGEFPHRAIGLVIEQLQSTGDTGSASTLLSAALGSYKKGSPFQDEDAEFFELLQSARGAVPLELYKSALSEFVVHLTDPKYRSQQPKHFKAEVRNPDGVFPFNSQKELLQFRVMPILKELGMPEAKSLANSNKALVHAQSGRSIIGGAGGTGATSSAQQTAIQQKSDKIVVKRQIAQIREFDPLAALSEVWRLPVNSPERLDTLTETIPAVVRLDQTKAREAYAELQAAVDALPEGQQKLHAIVAAAKAAYYVNYRSDYARYTSQAWDYGLEMVKSDIVEHGSALTLRRPGTRDLLDVTEFTAEHSGESVLKWVRPVEDNGLRAYLLLFAAKGLGTAEMKTRVLATN